MTDNFTAEDRAAGFDPGNIPEQAGAAPHAQVGGDEEYVLVYPPDGRVAETAKALNDAAAGRESTVQWTGEGAFRVPKSVADAADFGDEGPDIARGGPQSSSSPTQHTDGSGNVAPAGGPAPAIAETRGDIPPLAEDVSTVPEHPDSLKQPGTLQPRGGDPDGDGNPTPAQAEQHRDQLGHADGTAPTDGAPVKPAPAKRSGGKAAQTGN